MNSYKFSFLHSFRNILAKKGSSFIIIFTMSILIMVFILSVSMYATLVKYFTYEAEHEYINVDIVMTYDENSTTRLISTRDLKENYNDKISFASAWISYDTLFTTDEMPFYGKLLAGTDYELEQLIDMNVPVIGSTDCLITSSLADKKGLQMGDSISIDFGDVSVDFTIKGMVDDVGLFSGDEVFILKSSFFEDVYYTQNLDNIGNIVYIGLLDHVTSQDFINHISHDEDYQNYLTYATVDMNEIERASEYSSVLFLGISVLMFVALVFVLYSLLISFFKDFPKEQGIILSLGGQERYLSLVFRHTFLWFLVIATVVGSVLSFVVLNIGIHMYGIERLFFYPWWSILVASFLGFLFFTVLSVGIRKKISHQSSVSLITKSTYHIEKKHWIPLLGYTLLFIVFYFVKPFATGVNAIFITLISVLFFFSLFDFIIFWINNKSKSRSLFHLISLRNLSMSSLSRQSFRVLFIIFILLISVSSVRSYIRSESSILEDQITADYAMLGIADYDDSLIIDIENKYEIDAISQALVYQDVHLHFNQQIKNMTFSISMPYSLFESMYGFSLETNLENFTNLDVLYVILPKNMRYVYNVELGDRIQIDFSKDMQNVDVLVAGFFDSRFDNLIYTNLDALSSEYNVHSNSIFIDTDENIYYDLIEEYSMRFYYVANVQDIVSEFKANILRDTDLFVFLSYVLSFSFVVVMLNNMLLIFESQKSTYAKLISLGLPRKKMFRTFFFEFGINIIFIYVFSFIEMKILTNEFPKMMLLFHYYKEIVPTARDFITTMGILTGVLFCTYVYYGNKLLRINVVEESKNEK